MLSTENVKYVLNYNKWINDLRQVSGIIEITRMTINAIKYTSLYVFH